MVRLPEAVADVARLTELLQVLAGAEPAACAGDDDRAHRSVARLLQRVPETGVERAVERVEDVGAVERDRLNRAVARNLDLGHGADPTAR